jgi:tRNA pseudouridine55 synthase
MFSRDVHDSSSAIRIRVICSAGTYIRTLAEEIGRELGLGAHLRSLRRTAAGKFELAESLTIEQLQELTDPATALIPVGSAVSHLPEFVLSEDRVGATRNGLSTRTDDEYKPGEFVRMIAREKSVIAVGIYDGDEKVIRPKVVLI